MAEHLEAWSSFDPNELWHDLASDRPYTDASMRCAQFLWLQARSANCIPVWWDGTRWTSPSGSKAGGRCKLTADSLPQKDGSRRLGDAHVKATEGAHHRGDGRATSRGIVRTTTMARRIRRLDALDWSRVTVIHGLVQDVEPIPGATVYMDPPYLHAPRYAEVFPRARVLEVARRWTGAGARMLISEAEHLADLEGWSTAWLPHTRPEALTASWPIHIDRGEQLPLWEAA